MYLAYLGQQDNRKPDAMLTVKHHPEWLSMDVGEGPVHESGRVVNKNTWEGLSRRAKKGEQLELFYHRPANDEVDMLMSRDNPAAKLASMTMLGMADLESRKTRKQPLNVPINLSPHSANLVTKLKNVRAVASNFPTTPRNDFSFKKSEGLLDTMLSHTYANAQVKKGYREDVSSNAGEARKHIARVLRPDGATSRTGSFNPKTTEPEQLKLFEG